MLCFILSLISGRNPELLIGQHVISAPFVKQSGLEILSTGYMVIDGGAPTTVSYISNATPIPADKNEIAMCTAMAGEMLGMKIIYMDAGSGAKRPITDSMIEHVSKCIDVPLVIGGGITDPEKAYRNCKAGADVIVIGNAIEKDFSLIRGNGRSNTFCGSEGLTFLIIFLASTEFDHELYSPSTSPVFFRHCLAAAPSILTIFG